MSSPNAGNRNPSIDAVQSEEYAFPYHYIPSPNGYIKFSKSWNYSASYIAAINLATRWLRAFVATRTSNAHRHMDFGCGDGGFLYALNGSDEFKDVEFYGIDIDERALKWGELFTADVANVHLQCGDLVNLECEAYDSGTLIEVFEHIPPDEAPAFVSGISRSLKKGGSLFLTVPSIEIPVSDKHYRHFTLQSIQSCFHEHFDVVSCFGFEKSSLLSRILKSAMVRRRVYVETSVTSNYFIREFERTFPAIHGCGRIGLSLRKR